MINMKSFRDLIYSPESVRGEAVSKTESHIPKIEAPDSVNIDEEFKVRVNVGPHPNTLEHHIRRLELYLYEEGRRFNPVLLATIELTPQYVEPKLELTLKLKKSGILYAIAYCNIHGLWENRKEVKVK